MGIRDLSVETSERKLLLAFLKSSRESCDLDSSVWLFSRLEVPYQYGFFELRKNRFGNAGLSDRFKLTHFRAPN